MTYDAKVATEEQWQYTYENSAEARRVTLVDGSGGGVNNSNPLPVSIESTTMGTKVNNFGSSIVGPGVTITLVSYTVPAGKTFTFTGGIVGGNEQGLFDLKIAGTTIAQIRNSGSNPTIRAELLEKPTASATTLISIEVTNQSDLTRAFEATLSGVIQ